MSYGNIMKASQAVLAAASARDEGGQVRTAATVPGSHTPRHTTHIISEY